MDTIGSRIKARREALGWSQRELAKAAGVSTSTIGNLEAGIRHQPRSLLSIAAALGMSVHELADGAVKTGAGAASAKPLSTAEIVTLIDGQLKKWDAEGVTDEEVYKRLSQAFAVIEALHPKSQ